MTELEVTIRVVDDECLAGIGWAAVRRDRHLLIAIHSKLPRWRREVAELRAMTDEEYEIVHATLCSAERQRRARVAPEGWVSQREALIALRSAHGKEGRYDEFLASMPVPEQRRRALMFEEPVSA